MAVAIIRDPLSGIDFSAAENFRMYLYSETGSVSLSLPVAPRAISYGGFGADWVEAERSGNTPLLMRKSAKLETMQFSALMTSKTSMFFPQTAEINALRAVANTRERVLVRYSTQEAGLWRITSCTFDSELRHPDTNEVTRGMLSMSLTRASDAAPAVGPVSGGLRPAPGGPAPVPAAQRTHTVVKGDTLWGIAQKFYGSGPAWPRIFDANRSKIKNSHWIFPGQVFVIP